MTRVLLLGGSGQVGSALRRSMAPGFEVHAPTSAQLSLEDGAALADEIQRLRPQLVINAAAYTAVDRAEQEPDRAMAINARAPEILARETAALDAALVHYSTDYVFDGSKDTPYREDDPPAPLNVYGRSKLAGDEAVRAHAGAYLIFRTSWVYAGAGRNFLLTMRRLLRERDELNVVDDQIGAPTSAEAIAAATVAVVRQGGDEPAGFLSRHAGLFNLSCVGQTSWYGFACAIRNHMARSEPKLAKLRPIPTTEYPTPARRPAYSVLDNSRLRNEFGIELPDWRDGLAQVLRALEVDEPDPTTHS